MMYKPMTSSKQQFINIKTLANSTGIVAQLPSWQHSFLCRFIREKACQDKMELNISSISMGTQSANKVKLSSSYQLKNSSIISPKILSNNMLKTRERRTILSKKCKTSCPITAERVGEILTQKLDSKTRRTRLILLNNLTTTSTAQTGRLPNTNNLRKQQSSPFINCKNTFSRQNT